MDQQLCIHETVAIIFVLQPCLFLKNFEPLFNNVLGHNSLVCNDVGWWSGFYKVGDNIYDVDIGIQKIVEGIVTKNQVDTYHRAHISSSVTIFYGESIMYGISFFLQS